MVAILSITWTLEHPNKTLKVHQHHQILIPALPEWSTDLEHSKKKGGRGLTTGYTSSWVIPLSPVGMSGTCCPIQPLPSACPECLAPPHQVSPAPALGRFLLSSEVFLGSCLTTMLPAPCVTHIPITFITRGQNKQSTSDSNKAALFPPNKRPWSILLCTS